MKPISSEAESFLGIKSREDLANWMGLSDRRLRFLLYKLTENERYQTFEIAKRDGGKRVIDAPKDFLKAVQRKLLKVFEEIAPPAGIAKGFVTGLSIYDHAIKHRRQRWIVTADLDSFFPSINFGRVRGAFKARPFSFSDDVATVLAQICCKAGSLPQGAPTSPVISNLICRKLDRDLVKFSRKYKLSVTRYADDICFSTSCRDVPAGLATFSVNRYVPSRELEDLIINSGFKLNARKFHVIHRSGRQMVTGLLVNQRVAMPRMWRRQLRSILHVYARHGELLGTNILREWKEPAAVRNTPLTTIQGIVRGKSGFARWLDGKSGARVVEGLHRSYPEARSLLPRLAATRLFRLMTEGDTDALHLQAAMEWFQRGGDYLEIKPSFRNYSGDKGDSDLWETLLRIAKSEVTELTIGVFDCDNESFMRARSVDPGGYIRLGKMVYAFFLQRPVSSLNGPFCIESLYDRGEVQRVASDGRRIFFGDEFDAVSGLDASGSFRREFPRKKAVVVSDRVERISDGYSILMSKMDFAHMIKSKIAPFNDVNFAGFRPTFKALQGLLDYHDAS